MKRSSAISAAISVAAISFVPATSRAQADPVRSAIVATLAKFSDALKRGDATGAASIFARDATIVVPGDFVVGRDAIEAYYANRMKTRKYVEQSLTTISVYVSGDLAEELGTYFAVVEPSGQPRGTFTGHYLTTWRKQGDGSWLVQADAPIADPPRPKA